MAAKTSKINHMPLFYDSLLDFIHQLRMDGYAIGIGQYLHVQELLIKLAANKQMSDDPKELLSFIGPVLCSTSEEQDIFDDRYLQWAHQFSPKISEDISISDSSDEIQDSQKIHANIKTVQKRSRYWKQIFGISWGIIAIFMGMMLFYAAWETVFHYGVLSGLFLLLLIIFWRIWLHFEARKFLTRRSSPEKVMNKSFFVDKPSDTPFKTLSLMQTAQEFRRHRVVTSEQLDIPATIEQSIKQGGLFTPVKGIQKISPEYLALIERNTSMDHQSQFVDAMLDLIKKQGVYITHYYYDQSPLYCFPDNDRTKELHLLELIARYPEHRLMIFSSGEEMIDPFTDTSKQWIELFKAWESKALMTFSDEQSRYENIHPLFESDFIVIPATEAGFRIFIDSIQSEKKYNPTYHQQHNIPENLRENAHQLLHAYPPEEDDIQRILLDVKSFIGQSGYEWFAACAIYPALQWHLTLYLGINLTDIEHNQALFNIDTLAALSQLPWFRHGSMPDLLRKRLIMDMPIHQERNIRQLIHQLLISATHEPLHSFKLSVAEYEQRFFIRFAGKIFHKLTRKESQRPVQDYIFLSFMSDPLSVKIPKLLRQYFRQFELDIQSEISQKEEKFEKEVFKKTIKYQLRSTPQKLTDDEKNKLIDKNRKPKQYIKNDYVDNGNETITDRATGLMWQKGGSDEKLTLKNAKKYIKQLNKEKFGGHVDWRLPTLEELLSLLESSKMDNGLYIASVFSSKQRWCWSSDISRASSGAFRVGFNYGGVYWLLLFVLSYVRAVRSFPDNDG